MPIPHLPAVLMDLHLLLEQLVAQWRARAEDARATLAARADAYDVCAAQLADVLRQQQDCVERDLDSLDLFETRPRHIA
jgi:hypothetical protein